MSSPQVQAAPPGQQKLERRAREISDLARELAPETEGQRSLADDLVAALRASGLMMAGAPREVGGLELAPGLALRCPDEVARGDAAAGWGGSIPAPPHPAAPALPNRPRPGPFPAPPA